MAENHITEVGRLTADPDLKSIGGGKSVARFAIAVEKSWTNRQTQERETKTSFFNVVAWEKLGENVAASLKKGYRVIVVGSLEQREYETSAGDKRTSIEIIAEAVGPDLRFVTAEIHRGDRPQASAPADEEPF